MAKSNELNDIRTTLALLEQRSGEIKEMLARFNDVLFCETDGLILKVDRLEQQEEVRKWHIRAVWVAIITTLVAGALAKIV